MHGGELHHSGAGDVTWPAGGVIIILKICVNRSTIVDSHSDSTNSARFFSRRFGRASRGNSHKLLYLRPDIILAVWEWSQRAGSPALMCVSLVSFYIVPLYQ